MAKKRAKKAAAKSAESNVPQLAETRSTTAIGLLAGIIDRQRGTAAVIESIRKSSAMLAVAESMTRRLRNSSVGGVHEFLEAPHSDPKIPDFDDPELRHDNLDVQSDGVADELRRIRELLEERKHAATDLGPSPASVEFAHADDFTWVIWDGTQYSFTKGNQARAVEVLWEHWERSGRKDGCGCSEQTIGSKIGVDHDRFRMSDAFRDHPAWKQMIRQTGKKGVFALFSEKHT